MNDYGKIDKMAGFFNFGWRDGYKTSDLWWLMRNSTSGRGILSNNRNYTERYEGSASLRKAFEEVKPNFNKIEKPEEDLYDLSNNLSEFIEFTHEKYNLSYDDMFKKCDIDEFVERFGFALGNYDDKIVTRFLL